MFQDSEGFLWIGTTNGFCRYDGYEMTHFRSDLGNPAFASNYIIGGFAEDTLNNNIWIGTQKGAIVLNRGTHAIRTLDPELLGELSIRHLKFAGDAMWVCSDDGLFLYNLDGRLRKKYRDGVSNMLHIDSRGAVRVTTWRGGIHYLDRATDSFVPYPPIGPRNNPHKIFQDSAGRLWVCTWGDGIYRMYPERLGQDMYERVQMPAAGKLSSGIFFGIEQDEVHGYLWALSYTGLIVFNPDEHPAAPANEFTLPVNNITNIFSDIIKDREGNLWLGTYEMGVIAVNPNRSSVTNYDLQFIKAQTGSVPNIVKVFEDKDGELWLKHSRRGLFVLNLETSDVRPLDNIPDINAASAICNYSAAGEIWVATDYEPNICRLRKSGRGVSLLGVMSMRAFLPGNYQTIRFLHEDRRGVIWAASGDLLLSFEHGEWKVVNRHCGIITGIAEDSFGNLWLGTSDNGLLQILRSDDTLVIRIHNTSTGRIAGNHVSCITAGAEGQLWFAVGEKQLCSYDLARQEFRDYTETANADRFVISGVAGGNKGCVWISSDKQVVEFNPQTGASVQYDAWDDFAVTSLHGNSMTNVRSGSIVFGSNKGLCVLAPSMRLDMPCKKVKTTITDIKINGASIYRSGAGSGNPDRRRKLVLLPGETNLEINFSSFDYLNPGKTRYAYKLEGVDRQWIHTEPGRNFAVYNQLRRGEYSFLVKSTGDNRLWSDEITRLHIVRKPAFYETAWAYAGYTIVVLAVLFAGLRFYVNRIRLRNELRVVQLDKEKSEELIQTKLRFFTNIGHEFRTPLTLIMTPLGSLIGRLTDEALKQKLSSIYRNAEQMLGLINQLLDFRKLEVGGEKLELSCCDFVQFAEYIYSAFKDVAESRGIQFSFESEPGQVFMGFDKSKIRKIINNLYSNALKFTPEDGYISTGIRLVRREGREFVRLEIADSGCGVPDDEQQTVFERFYQSKNNDPDKTGTGLGLHLVREYAGMHGGQITLSSKVGCGSVFSLFVPTDLQAPGASPDCGDEAAGSAGLQTVNPDRQQKTLLIAEDNLELRRFLAEQLSGKFNILQSANGKDGADLALRQLPDLIVSDIMMPIMNGLDMCQRLKTDIQTSHIPIILLTARLSDESQIESYKAGADSYIAKPFSFEVLLARIEMLIEQQEKRRRNFHKNIEITPSSITPTSLDEELIKKALLVVEKNMDNSEYSVDELAAELSFSRRQLLRKFQSIIGLSPGEFIRSFRVKRAAQLLKDTQYNISEISDRVGFSDVKYFNLNFKNEFGLTPTQYRKGTAKS
jgi:signal transduction histidine kinase/DNA-binding response OmpR family regulator/ligand-binding sensor domain-containing protein